MENFPLSKSLRRSVKRRGYKRVDGEEQKKTKIVKFGSGMATRRVWKIKVVPKLRFMATSLSSPLKMWKNIKSRYMNMMLNFANDGNNVFGQKRIPQARQPQLTYDPTEFENRLVIEIYKSLVASRELATPEK